MELLSIIVIAYIAGGLISTPKILRSTRERFEDEVTAGKVPPGTEIIGLFVSQVVSLLFWPFVIGSWLVEVATQRVKQRRS